MTNPTDAKRMPNTAPQDGSLPHLLNTIGAEKFGPPQHKLPASATVFFKHKYLTNPTVLPTDALIAAAANLVHVIKHNAKAQHLGAKNLQDLSRLQHILSYTTKQHLDSPSTPQQAPVRNPLLQECP
jgi:hypothetical protein